METPTLIFLVVSCVISFGLGRTFVYFRDKKRKARAEELKARQAQFLREQPPEAESKNKAKRRRQLQELEKSNRAGRR
ncbi:MAG: hypothetical protein EOO28_35810 [Comamonadaceae bacterium]|nr:MAG: hypothetical protein EOO28_35810 [Comamonadaceae bacterium]